MGSQKQEQNRRQFIKTAVATGGGIAALSFLKPFSAVLYAAKEPKEASKPWYGYAIDITKCIGCGRCANACKAENGVSREPFFFRTWVEQYTIKNDGSVKVESPNGGIDGFTQSIPVDDIFQTFFVPKLCNQCYKSPCVQVCPVGATFVSPEGVVLVDQNYCIGCRYCVQACPYGCRYIDPVKNVADKCTLCYHRITKGLQPACIENCPTGARMFGDLHDHNGPLFKFLKEHNTMVLKPNLNTGSKLYYNALRAEVR